MLLPASDAARRHFAIAAVDIAELIR